MPGPYVSHQEHPWPAFAVATIYYVVALINVEPIGTAPPKFPTDERFKKMERRSGGSVNLLCPAQSSPLPSFRYFNPKVAHEKLAFRQVLGLV